MKLIRKHPQTKEVIIIAIICLTMLEIIALIKGIDGTYFVLISTTIAGLAGWVAPQLKLPKLGIKYR